MKITIDTENKTIEIEQATMQEILDLPKKYKNYKVISKTNWSYPWYVPYVQTEPLQPYYSDWKVVTTTDGTDYSQYTLTNN